MTSQIVEVAWKCLPSFYFVIVIFFLLLVSVNLFLCVFIFQSCENSIVCWKPQEEFEEIFKGVCATEIRLLFSSVNADLRGEQQNAIFVFPS